MSHWVLEGEVKTIKGTPFRVVKRDDKDEVVWKDREREVPETVDATVKDVLELVIFRQPQATITRQDSIHATRLYNQVWESGKRDVGRYEVEDAEWDWVKKKLEDDKVGPAIFGIQLKAVGDSLEALEKAGAEARKVEAEGGAHGKNGQGEPLPRGKVGRGVG